MTKFGDVGTPEQLAGKKFGDYLTTEELPAPSAYVRPPDWLPLPTVNVGEQKFVGLVAVDNTANNLVALKCVGAYTVDWGDGTAPQNVATNVVASHNYAWANVPSNTLTARGYRQAIATVTPQAGQNLTVMDLTSLHPNQRSTQSNRWLDVKMSLPNMTTLAVNATRQAMLERFEWVGTATGWAGGVGFFNSLKGLKSFNAPQMMNHLTTFVSMFQNCTDLVEVTLGTANGTTFGQMFQGCTQPIKVALSDTSKGTSFVSMFRDCVGLIEAPVLDMSSAANLSYMFLGCTNLRFIPDYDTAKVTDFTETLKNCTTLPVVPAWSFAGVSSQVLGATFSGCYSVTRFRATGIKVTFAVTECNMAAAELNEMYTNLGTTTSQTVTVTGNWGTAADTPGIAQAKGWAVSG